MWACIILLRIWLVVETRVEHTLCNAIQRAPSHVFLLTDDLLHDHSVHFVILRIKLLYFFQFRLFKQLHVLGVSNLVFRLVFVTT